MKKVFYVIPVAVTVLIIALAISTLNLNDLQDQDTTDTISVGVLLPATGDLSVHGQDNLIAIQLALHDFNEHLESIDATWQMKLIIEDTQTDPIVALEKAQSLNSKGVKLVLGPETSSEIRNIKSYVDSNQMLLISPSSTSPKLAFEDNIFRLIPDDTQQGKVLAKLLSHNDVKVAIPIYRGDVWGDGLYESVKTSFESDGGILDPGIRYSPEITVFSTESSLLSDTVDKYLQTYQKEEIAILMISFSEAVHLINSANSYDNLHDVLWLGTDASSNDDTITNDPISLAFVVDTSFSATQFAVSSNEKYEYIKKHLIEQTGTSPNNYAYSSYDSVWLLGLSILETGSTDVNKIKDVIPDVASNYSGAIGQIELNEYGDLAISDYDLWGVDNDGWILDGRYYTGTDSFEFFDAVQ